MIRLQKILQTAYTVSTYKRLQLIYKDNSSEGRGRLAIECPVALARKVHEEREMTMPLRTCQDYDAFESMSGRDTPQQREYPPRRWGWQRNAASRDLPRRVTAVPAVFHALFIEATTM